MKIVETSINYNLKLDKYFNIEDICFMDIETTGLSRAYHNIYLIGILYFDSKIKTWKLNQILAESIDEEKEVLIEACKLISKFSKIITYNGESFDIPFINYKLDFYNMDHKILLNKSYDLYRLVRENRQFLDLENMKLKTIEKKLDIHREDIYTGKDCIRFYNDYVKSKDKDLLAKILKHNYDDLYYLPYIIKIQDVIDNKRSIKINDMTIYIEDIIVEGDSLIVRGFISDNMNLIYYGNNYRIIIDDNNRIEIGIELNVGLVTPTLKCLFVDKKELALSNSLYDSTNYKIPENILLIKVDKSFCIDNIKSIIKNLISNSLREAY